MKINYYNSDKGNIIFPENLDEVNNKIKNICKNLQAFNVLNDKTLLEETIKKVKKFSASKKFFYVFGTGGSNLGARALINSDPNILDSKIYFIDNIDPIFFEKLLKNIDLETSGFIVISKSGETAETLSQLGCLIQLANEKNKISEFYQNCLIITEFKNSPLFNIAKKNNCFLLEHNKNIGGRYSIFTNVAIVPAIIAGIDVKAFYKGGIEIVNNFEDYDLFNLGLLFKFQKKTNYSLNVVMTYSDSLKYFGKWYLQLWAESIGKNKKGVTAIHSVGTTDQHSQLQLYLDGPKDKFFTFITTNHSNLGMQINNQIMEEQNIKYLSNIKMGDLMQAEQQAIIDTFNNLNFNFRNIHIPKIDTYSIGSLFATSIIETIAACIYFEADPFNQPSVEQGKRLTKDYLSR